jgi:RNA polymerase sigma-70 factor (ECF subfamily)
MPPPQPPYLDIEELVRATHREAAALAFRIVRNDADAQDATQSAYVKVWLKWPEVGRFSTAAKQRAYLLKTVRNEALLILRRRQRRKESFDLDESGDPLIPDHLSELLRTRRDLKPALEVIDGLPAACRRVVKLRMDHRGYDEIATMLGISVSTARSHVSNARKRVRQVMPRDWKGE